jgi:hypothetical protein
MKNVITATIGILVLVSVSMAGIIMSTQFQDLQDKKVQPMIQTTYLQKDMIRMDMKADKSDMTTIFLGEKELFLMIDHKKKSYTEMTKEDLEKMQKAAEQIMTTVDEALKNLPPAMQEKMKNLMQPKQEKKSEIVYKKVAGDEKINQWICDKYEGKRDSIKEMDVWTADWKKLGLKQEDLSGFDQMGKFFQSMMKNMNWFYNVGTEEKTENMYIGFPVKTISYNKEKPASQYEIQSIKQEELKETVFQVPQGYKKEKVKEDK